MFPLDSGIKRESIKGNVKVSGLLKEMVVFLLEWGVVKECFQGKRHFLLNHIETERQVEIWVERSFFFKIYLFIFGSAGSSLLCTGVLSLWLPGATVHCGARAYCSVSLVAEHRLWGIGFSSRSTGTQ